MILTKTVKTKMVPFTRKHYESLNYIYESNKEIEIPIEHLPLGSSVLVDVICAGECKQLFSIRYGAYIDAVKKNSLLKDYCCKKCFPKIRIELFVKKYGVNSPMKLESFKNKKKETMLKLYNVEYSMQNKETVKIGNKTRKNTVKEKYGVDNVFFIPGVRDKKNNTMLELYGTINSQEIPETKNKTKQTLLDKYGVNSVRNIPGVEEKIRLTKERLGLQRPKELISALESFRYQCVTLKNKMKKELFKIWDGYDFYDKEYIKNNLCLPSNDPCYPTIDHKISILYGFLNNITIDEISAFENLCITKRKLNSKKKGKNEKEFIEKLQSN
jgi:hypothetical protein